MEAKRGLSDLEAAIDDVVSLLKGAINDRGCAISAFADVDGGRDGAKSSVGDSGMPRHNGARTTHASAVVLHQRRSPTSYLASQLTGWKLCTTYDSQSSDSDRKLDSKQG